MSTEDTSAQSKLQELIAVTTEDVRQWELARNGCPYPEFSDSVRADEAWHAGISEGIVIGKLKALKEVGDILSSSL